MLLLVFPICPSYLPIWQLKICIFPFWELVKKCDPIYEHLGILDVRFALLSNQKWWCWLQEFISVPTEVRNVSSVKQDNIYMVIHVDFLSCCLFSSGLWFCWPLLSVLSLTHWMNHKPYLKSARARAIVLFFVCTHCLTLWSSGCWIGVTDAITKQPATAQGPLGTQTVRKIRPSGSIHHCFSITSQWRHIRENGAE